MEVEHSTSTYVEIKFLKLWYEKRIYTEMSQSDVVFNCGNVCGYTQPPACHNVHAPTITKWEFYALISVSNNLALSV